MAIGSRSRATSASGRQAVPKVPGAWSSRSSGPARRRNHAIKTGIGLVVLLAVVGVGGALAFDALRSLGDSEEATPREAYLAGDGEEFTSRAGRFTAEFPEMPEARTGTLATFVGDVELSIVGIGLDDDTSVEVAWFDLPEAPAADQAAGVLAGMAVFLADDLGGTPSNAADPAGAGSSGSSGAEYEAYEFAVALDVDEPEASVVLIREVLVDERLYVLRVDSDRARPEVLEYLAESFSPT